MELSRLLKNKLYRDIVVFFHKNQTSIDTPRGIATWIKQERTVVKRALDKLVEIGILIDHRSSSTTGYSYTRDEKIIKDIAQQLNSCD